MWIWGQGIDFTLPKASVRPHPATIAAVPALGLLALSSGKQMAWICSVNITGFTNSRTATSCSCISVRAEMIRILVTRFNASNAIDFLPSRYNSTAAIPPRRKHGAARRTSPVDASALVTLLTVVLTIVTGSNRGWIKIWATGITISWPVFGNVSVSK